jgi:hypothetical protein
MVGMAPAKSIYAVPTWTRIVALVAEHPSLRAAICGPAPDVPSVYAGYPFMVKLRTTSKGRGLDRFRLHAELTILAKLACALDRQRAVAVAA